MFHSRVLPFLIKYRDNVLIVANLTAFTIAVCIKI